MCIFHHLSSSLEYLPFVLFLGFPGGSDGKESSSSAEDLSSIPGVGRSSGGRHGNPLQYSYLENPHVQRSWQPAIHPWSPKESDTTEWLGTVVLFLNLLEFRRKWFLWNPFHTSYQPLFAHQCPQLPLSISPRENTCAICVFILWVWP